MRSIVLRKSSLLMARKKRCVCVCVCVCVSENKNYATNYDKTYMFADINCCSKKNLNFKVGSMEYPVKYGQHK